ncbi:MAG: hypothetical protein Q9203_003323 [Teloschistes exilis]
MPYLSVGQEHDLEEVAAHRPQILRAGDASDASGLKEARNFVLRVKERLREDRYQQFLVNFPKLGTTIQQVAFYEEIRRIFYANYAEHLWVMASMTGPPQGTLKYMTPYPIANDPPTPKPIPDIVHPHVSPVERAAKRFSLSGKRAIVTGGAQGLGIVCARAMLEHGVSHLAIFDVEEKQGHEAVEHLLKLHQGSEPKPVVGFRCVDVTNETAVNIAVFEVAQAFGGIDLLVSFAGITGSELSVNYDIQKWKQIFDVNLHGSFLVARAVARELIAQKSPGSMVFTASMSGFVVNTPQPHPAYAVSKAAVHHLARSLAGEWVGHQIRVNSISPGIMNTRLSGGPAQADLRKLWLEKSPMGIGDPEDLTGAVVLLCSDAGKFITGTDIKLDGRLSQLDLAAKLLSVSSVEVQQQWDGCPITRLASTSDF